MADDYQDESDTFEGDALGMSDEEVMRLGPAGFQAQQQETPDEEEAVDEEPEEEDEQEEAVEDDAADDERDESESESESDDDSDESAPVEAKAESEKKEEPKQQEIDYKAQYERILAPFKANGKEVAVDNVEEAIALMQMGANYSKKMAALKPNLKLLKLLENNKLLDEQKLSYLIDLDKKNPAAITKLIKDSGIDPLDVDVEKGNDYKPNTYTVDDREIELDSVLEELKETPTYSSTLDIVGNKWDGPSKQVVADNPQLLKIINDHVARGIYPIISKEVDKQRMLGRLTGMSDLDAYRVVGDAIDARGGFNHLTKSNAPAGQKVAPPAKKQTDPALIDKKRAASSAPKAAPDASDEDFNPLSLSDEEFAKVAKQKFR